MKSLYIAVLLTIAAAGCRKAPSAGADGNSAAGVAARLPLPAAVVVEAEETKDRAKLRTEAKALLEEGDYDKIEQRARGLREAKSEYPDGHWRLTFFYSGLEYPPTSDSDAAWRAHCDKLKEWIRKTPGSITARVALVRVLQSYAWKARGSGYGNTVTPEGWARMRERLAEGRQVLFDAQALPAKCPEWYTALQGIALGESWFPGAYDKHFNDAVAAEPAFYEVYFGKAYHLQPRWFGKQGEWEAFAETSANEMGGDAGDMLYARIVWSVRDMHLYEDIFKESTVSWPRVKRGFQALLKKHPDSLLVASEFCYEAVLGNDAEQAKILLTEYIKGRVEPTVWDVETYGEFAKFAFLK